MKKKLAVLLAAALTLGMTACGASKGAGDTGKSEKSMVYAVEAGSAGEEAAKEKGFQYNSVSSQADALMEVASGTSDAAIIDLQLSESEAYRRTYDRGVWRWMPERIGSGFLYQSGVC